MNIFKKIKNYIIYNKSARGISKEKYNLYPISDITGLKITAFNSTWTILMEIYSEKYLDKTHLITLNKTFLKRCIILLACDEKHRKRFIVINEENQDIVFMNEEDIEVFIIQRKEMLHNNIKINLSFKYGIMFNNDYNDIETKK